MALLAFILAIIMLIVQVSTQDISTCSLRGDPHLIPFAANPGAALPQGYWCRRSGRMTVLTNQYIEIYVNVTSAPFWNENYEIKFKSGPNTLCIVTSSQNQCNHQLLDSFRPRTGNGLDIVYADADDLHVIITDYVTSTGKRAYDILIEQSFALVRVSRGLCIQMTSACRLESVLGKRRRRSTDQSTAINVCAQYMKQANITARALAGNTGSPLVKHAEEACINDVFTSSQPQWGESAISFVVLDAIKQAKFSKTERRNKIATAFLSISAAAAQAKKKADTLLNIETAAFPKAESYL